MKLSQLLNIELLDKHRMDGFVGVQFHPTLPLRIYNYTHLAQYDGKAWGDGTIDYCRGLIVDNEDNIVARPFKKFHNLNTASVPQTMEENLPQSTPLLTKKMDGSMGIWYSDGTPQGAIATRGSFTSEQAQWATSWWKKQNFDTRLWSGEWTPQDWTPLFEIIYPQNRIVVDYRGYEGLICIGGIEIDTGRDISRSVMTQAFGVNKVVDVVWLPDGSLLGALAKDNLPNEEGYVAQYSNGLRVKIKFEDYVRLHRIVTGMNARSVWERLKAGDTFENFKTGYPEPFTKRLFHVKEKLQFDFMNVFDDAYEIFFRRPQLHGVILDPRTRRKADASWFFEQGRHDLKSLFFMLLDGKDITEAAWDSIEPRGDDKSFRQEGE